MMIEYFILVVIFSYLNSMATHIRKLEGTVRQKAIGNLVFGLLNPLWIVLYPLVFCYKMVTGKEFFNDKV